MKAGAERSVRRWRLLVVLLMLLPALGCGTPGPLPLTEAVDYFIDPAGRMSIEDVMARSDEFRSTPGTPPTLGRIEGAAWFRLRLLNQNRPPQMILELNAFSIETLEVFQAGRRTYRGGINQPFQWRSTAHRNLIIPVTRAPGSFTELYLRVETRATTELPLRLWNPPDFQRAALIEYYALGMFLGCVVIMAGYNLFLWASIRETAFFYYVFYSLAMAYFVLDQDGIITHFFQTGENFRPWSFLFGTSILVPSAALFTGSYLSLDRHVPALGRILKVFALLSACSFLLGFSGLAYRTLLGLMNLELVFLLILVLAGWIATVRNRSTEAYMLAAAFLPVILIGIYRLLWFFGLFGETNFLFQHGMKIGIVLELLILSLGLAGRYNRLRSEHLASLLRAAEERRRLTGEVHDNIGGFIGAALLQLREGDRVDQARGTLETALRNARDFASIMRMSDETETTLENDVRDFARRYAGVRGFSMKVRFDPVFNPLEPRVHIHLLRILQEWVSNSMRHGKARVFAVQFVRRRRFVVRLQSDGEGFAWDSRLPEVAPGYGLRGIRERVAALGGRARSRPGREGRGTSFVLVF